MNDKPGMIGQALYGKRIETLEAERDDLRRKLDRIAAIVDGTAFIDDHEPPLDKQMETIGRIAKGAPHALQDVEIRQVEPDKLTIEIGRGLATLDIEFIQAIEKEIDAAMVHMGFSRENSTKSGDFVKATYRQFGVCRGE